MSQYKTKQAKKSQIPDDLSGKVALITGGAKRIGAEIATTFHAAGMTVVIHYRGSAESARALQKQLNALRKESCLLIQGELSELPVLKSIIDETIRQHGRLDVLVNNASAFFPTPLAEAKLKDWDTLFDANLKAPFFLCQAAAPHLAKTQGCIINMIDIYAEKPLKDHPLYCASKAGLASLTRSFAQSLAPEVRVNGIAPGAILWPDPSKKQSPKDDISKQRILSRTPLKRLGEPQDIAKTALFLVQSAPYISGQIINIDGGRSII